MANKILFISSTICGLILFIYLIVHYNCISNQSLILIPFIIFGFITSLLNHGKTSNFYKFLDRITITMLAILLITLIIYNKRKICMIILLVSIGLFLLAKYIYQYSNNNHTIPHLMSHIFATISLLYLFSYDIYLTSSNTTSKESFSNSELFSEHSASFE